jgi:hypothetical protein
MSNGHKTLYPATTNSLVRELLCGCVCVMECVLWRVVDITVLDKNFFFVVSYDGVDRPFDVFVGRNPNIVHSLRLDYAFFCCQVVMDTQAC